MPPAPLEVFVRHCPPLVLAASAFGLAGCSTPYSELVGTRFHRAPIDTYPVSVVAVDGEHYLREPVLLEPGTRRITVQAPPTAAQTHGSQRTVSLDVQPCTRYHLVAQRESRLQSGFTVKVDHEQPVPGCVRPGEPLRAP